MKLSLVIPIYNEEAILEREVESLVFDMAKIMPHIEYELLLVENGSHDQTCRIADDLAKRHAHIRVLHLPDAGYGQALKQGLLSASGDSVVLFNIDFWDVPFVRNALSLKAAEQLDMVVGSKTMPGAEDTRPWLRRLITRVFNWLLRLLFGFRGTDTHGMKLLVRAKMIPVIEACRTEKEIFDTEFVLRAEAAGFMTREIPVVCEEKRKTTYRISKRIPRTIKDLAVLFFTLRSKNMRKRNFLFAFSVIIFFIYGAFTGFPDSPSPWFDQGVNLGIAKTFIEDGVYSLRLAPGEYVENRPLMISTNFPLLFPIITVFHVFGVGLPQAQVVMLLSVALYLCAAGFLIYRLFGKQVVLPCLALVVTFLPLYGNGLSGGLGEVAGLAYLMIGLLFLDKADRTEKMNRKRLFFAGVFLGLCAATKVFYLTVLFAFGISELIFAFKERRIPSKRWVFLGAGIVLPMMLWLATLMPEGWSMDGLRQVWTYYRNPYAVHGTWSGNLYRFITETTPIHFALLAIPFFFFLIRRVRSRDIRQFEIIIGLFVLLNILFYLKTPGWYRYLFPAHLTVLLFFPASLASVSSVFHHRLIRVYAMPVVVGALLLAQAVHFFGERQTPLYYNPAPREFAASLDGQLPDADIMIFDQPELWFLLKNSRARQYVQMNPYIAFGEDVFASGLLPEYIVSGEPEKNLYLSRRLKRVRAEYVRVRQSDRYVLYKRSMNKEQL